MEVTNGTMVQAFIFLGFGAEQQEQLPLLIFFATLYVFTVAENITVISLVFLDAQLTRLPMYILLSSFSWWEICYVTTTVPRMLFDLASHHGTISFHACFLQFYLFLFFGITECFFLSAMALDRYLAICHPLHYSQIMSQNSCCVLVSICWVVGFLWYLIPVILISKLSFCGPNVIDHFVCDPGPILALACAPPGIVPFVSWMFMNVLFACNISFVLLSYSIVSRTLMKSANQGSWKKAFSTIFFHIMVVTFFYSTSGAMYLIPGGESHLQLIKAVTVFYTAITPSLSPLIYCLRNNQVREALGRLLKRKERWLQRKVIVQ